MTKICFWLIGDFASQELCDIVLAQDGNTGFLNNAIDALNAKHRSENKTLPQAFQIQIEWFPKGKINLKNEAFIPLILCDDRESFKNKGITCPYEFIIERRDLFPVVDKSGIISDPVITLSGRIDTLAHLYYEKPKGFFFSALKDWFAGTFRLILMLDSTTHGTSQYVDLELVKKGKDPILKSLAEPQNESESKNVKKLRCRFDGDGDDEVKSYLPFVKDVFPEYFCKWDSIPNNFDKIDEAIGRSVTKILSWGNLPPEKKHEQLCRIYTDSDKTINGNKLCPLEHDNRLPLAFGDRAKYVTPTGKLNLLLIDDNVNESPFAHLEGDGTNFASSISANDWDLLREIFNVKTMQVNKSKGDIYREAVINFRDFHKNGLTFDLILVDLCLGNNQQGADLDGYSMIRIVKAFFPGTPIVVYSRFSDMEHIARAFFNGAKWFLVKGEEAKLPRHVLKLLKQVGWHKEWRSVKKSFHAPKFLPDSGDDFFRLFDRTEQWKYLTYKSLENFPGKFITVKGMSGGISSSQTFTATKGVKVGDDFLQTPCIIKIDNSYNTMMEFERYDRLIRPYIANECGRVEMPERILNRTYSSIVYTFAGKQDQAHTLESMGAMLNDNMACQTICDYETYRYALKCIFDEILPKIHRVSPELEFADIEKPSVLPSDVMDAFAWKEEVIRKSSFPNFYYSEFQPKDFWKSYMIRMQPWRRINLDITPEWPFKIQGSADAQKRLIFHDVIIDPFAKKDDRLAGSRIIEAYTNDGKLVWLDGDACDFVARFRKCISPGTSLWFDKLDVVDDKGNLSGFDERVEWLKKTFASNRDENAKAGIDFRKAIASLVGIDNLTNLLEYRYYIDLQDDLIKIAKETADKAKEWDMKCPVGIVHGDLNLKNIMLESRKHPPKEGDPDATETVSDVWLIDFARTRRDLIAHDFNVFFTSVLGALFADELIGKGEDYWNNLTPKFKALLSAAVAPKVKSEKGIPDEIKDDRRLTLIYRILRRTHDAAIAAGISQNMYLLTTALTCLYTAKIFLKKSECKVRLAAGHFAAAWICYDLLCEAIDYKTVESKTNSKPKGSKKANKIIRKK
ncbi:hypothetical protein J6U78_07565 [bacterium]|nr:hypothetical protein [bacterium]